MPDSIQIPIAQIKANPKNPRKVIRPDMVSTLATSLKTATLKNPIKVTANADGTYTVFSGHIRLAAATQLGWESILAQVLVLTPEEALLESILDNRGRQMSWLEDYEAAESLLAINPKLTQQDVADQLGMTQSTVSRGMKMLNALNNEARGHIYQNLINPGADEVPEAVVIAVTALKNPDKVTEALKVAIDQKMTANQAKALVASMQTGTSAEAHVPAPKAPKQLKAPKAASPELAPSQQALKPTPAPSNNAAMGTSESLAWDALAGISLTAKIKAKIKAGQRPSFFEILVLVADLLYRGLHWLAKAGWKVAKWLVKENWKVFKTVLRDISRKVFKIVSAVLGIVFLCFMAWFCWDSYEHGIAHPFEEMGSLWALYHAKPFVAAKKVTPAVTPIVASLPTAVPTLEPTPIPAKVMAKHKKKVVAEAIPTIQPTPTVVKKDAVGDAAGSVAKQVAPDLAADAAKKIFGL